MSRRVLRKNTRSLKESRVLESARKRRNRIARVADEKHRNAGLDDLESVEDLALGGHDGHAYVVQAVELAEDVGAVVAGVLHLLERSDVLASVLERVAAG